MKKWLIIVGIILLFGMIGFFYFHHTNRPSSLKTVTVTKGDISEEAQAVGYIKPLHSITIKSQVSGIVEEYFHDEGEYVKKGEPLIKINPTPSPEEYASAYQAYEKAAKEEQISKIDLDRYTDALKTGLISKSYADYIASQKTYESSKSDRVLAQQKLALLETGTTKVAGKNIANVVYSPMDGYILSRMVDVGDPVISLSSYQSSTPLFSMANMSDMMFEGEVDEMDASKIHQGMDAVISVGALPDQNMTGKLSSIALQSQNEDAAQGATSSSDANSPFNVGFTIKITDIKAPKSVVLRSGYSATANIKVTTKKDILILPERVVHFEKDQSYVLLPNGKDQKQKKQMITLGISDGVNVEVKTGLKEGDQVLDQMDQPDSDEQ